MFIINQVILGMLLIFAVLTFILRIKRKSSIANYTNFAWIICSFFLALNMFSSKLYENDMKKYNKKINDKELKLLSKETIYETSDEYWLKIKEKAYENVPKKYVMKDGTTFDSYAALTNFYKNNPPKNGRMVWDVITTKGPEFENYKFILKSEKKYKNKIELYKKYIEYDESMIQRINYIKKYWKMKLQKQT